LANARCIVSRGGRFCAAAALHATATALIRCFILRVLEFLKIGKFGSLSFVTQ
jgi:hypothetical protein